MVTAYLVVTLLAIAANAFSGVAALAHFQPIIPGMVKAGVPESWLTFPIGTLKTAGAVGLLLGPSACHWSGRPPQSASSCSSSVPSTPTCARDYSPQFGLAVGFPSLAVAALIWGMASP